MVHRTRDLQSKHENMAMTISGGTTDCMSYDEQETLEVVSVDSDLAMSTSADLKTGATCGERAVDVGILCRRGRSVETRTARKRRRQLTSLTIRVPRPSRRKQQWRGLTKTCERKKRIIKERKVKKDRALALGQRGLRTECMHGVHSVADVVSSAHHA